MAVSAEEVDIVLDRIRIMPSTIKLNIGALGSFTRDELLKEISGHTQVGEMVVQMQMEYLRSFKDRVQR